jgi:hypothetical protein
MAHAYATLAGSSQIRNKSEPDPETTRICLPRYPSNSVEYVATEISSHAAEA